MGNSESSQNISSHLKSSPNFKFLNKLFDDNSTNIKDGSTVITKSSFNKLFLGEETQLPNLLYKHFVSITEDGKDVTTGMPKHAFINGFDILVKLGVESPEMIDYYLDVFNERNQNLSQTDCVKILCIIHEVYKSHMVQCKEKRSSDESTKNIEALSKCLTDNVKETSGICKTSVVHQILQCCPRLFNEAHWWVLRSMSKLDGSGQVNLHYKKCSQIQLITDPNSSDPLLDQIDLWIMSLSIPQDFLKNQTSTDKDDFHFFVVQWKRLYNSNEHGLSHNRFKHHCFSYRGSTVMVILLKDDRKLVLTMGNEWKESTKCYGDSNTRLYQLNPEFKLLAENNIVLYNERTRGLPVGLVLGENPSKPVVSIMDGLTIAKINYSGISQEKSVEQIELWGCAGLKAEANQKQQRKWQDKQAEQLQKVKLPGHWDDNPDKSLLEMAGITTEHAQR